MKDKVLIKNSTLDDIGRAIIDKGGSEGPLYPQNMPSAIRSIAGGATTISWDKVTGKPSTFPPSAHKDTHKTGGSDALSPADIGAATEASVASLAASKQDKINDLNDIRSKANAGASHAGSTGNPHATEFAELNNVPTEFTPSAHTHPASQVTDLATVATSGSYNDLSNKPSIPVLENNVTESGANGVKSSGIWSWVKSLLPTWLNKNYVEPATVASVTALDAAKVSRPSGGDDGDVLSKSGSSEAWAAVSKVYTSGKTSYIDGAGDIYAKDTDWTMSFLIDSSYPSTELVHVTQYGADYWLSAASVMYIGGRARLQYSTNLGRWVLYNNNDMSVQYSAVGSPSDEEVTFGIAVKVVRHAASSSYVKSGSLAKVSQLPTSEQIAAWNAKEDKLTFDDTPTSGSTNPATSSGIHSALSGKQASLEYSSSKAYDVGSPCIYQNALYTCKVAIVSPGENWNSDHWQKVADLVSSFSSIGTQTASVSGGVANLTNLFSTGNTTLKNTITSTVPATAMRVSTGDPELYELRTGAADPWDAKLDTLSMASPWTTAVEYNMGDFVTYQGKAYQASTHTTSSDVPGVSSAWRQANLPNLFTRDDTSTEIEIDGLLKNAELEKSVKVCAQKYGGTQIKQDDQGNFYYEVEE